MGEEYGARVVVYSPEFESFRVIGSLFPRYVPEVFESVSLLDISSVLLAIERGNPKSRVLSFSNSERKGEGALKSG